MGQEAFSYLHTLGKRAPQPLLREKEPVTPLGSLLLPSQQGARALVKPACTHGQGVVCLSEKVSGVGAFP